MATETGDKTTTPTSGGHARPAAPSGSYRQAQGPYKGRPSTGPGGFRRPLARRKVCRVCQDRNGYVDWKAVNFLRNFVTDRGKIIAGRVTGTCAGCQRKLTTAIKRAQNMALLPTSPLAL